jgi:hypothetical protein
MLLFPNCPDVLSPQDQTELSELEKKYRGVLVCHFCNKNTPDEKSKISKTI